MNVDGKKVVVTGTIAGESRATAEQKLMQAGALVQPRVTKETDLLVTGAKVGQTKIKAAEKNGARIVAWETVWGDGSDEEAGDAKASPAPRPAASRQIAPMLAKGGELPKGEAWFHEVKWDGYRCVATVRGGAVTMQSRSGASEYAEQFPQVAAALAQLPDCVLDGELVVLDGNGHSSFEAMGSGSGDFIVFDLLEREGEDLRPRPLDVRRAALERLLEQDTSMVVSDFPVHLSPRFEDGRELLAYVRKHGLEGIVSKRRDSAYREGSRSGEWVKVKVRLEQEFVVMGWIPGENGNAGGLGALVLGYHEAGELVYAGKVGTGWTWEEGLRLMGELGGMTARIQNLPTDVPTSVARDVVMWVEARVVVQVQFQRWTKDGVLWHPSYKGQRRDKTAAEVVRES